MDRNVCTHEPETQWGSFGDWFKDYFCSICNAKVGYFSRLIWRSNYITVNKST